MTTGLRNFNPAGQLYSQDLSGAWQRLFLSDPSVWEQREPAIEDMMLRDPDIAHVVGYRRSLIAGRQWALVPRYEQSDRAQLATGVGTELLECLERFTDVRQGFARAFFSGSRFGRVHGEMRRLKIGDGVVRDWWCPVRVEDIDKRRFRREPVRDPRTNEILGARWMRWHIGPRQWVPETVEDSVVTIRHVYQDDEASLGHGRGLRDALGWPWYAKSEVFSQSLNTVERFASGILIAKVKGVRSAGTNKPNTQLINDWKTTLTDLLSRNVLVFDSDDDVQIVDPSGTGWQLLTDIRKELRSTIFTLVLGATVPTGGSGEEGGSYAMAQIQENSTESLVQYDREVLEETLTEQLIRRCLWFKNWANLRELGIHNEPPRFTIAQEKRHDPKERVQVAMILNQMGVPLAADDLAEQTGFRRPEEGEDIVEPAQQDPQAFGQEPNTPTAGLPRTRVRFRIRSVRSDRDARR